MCHKSYQAAISTSRLQQLSIASAEEGKERMLGKFPTENANLTKAVMDRQLSRLGVVAEFDAISLDEQLVAATYDKNIKAVFLDIAREEKTHVGEFLTLLLEKDDEQVRELESGKKEIKEESD